MHDHVKLHVLDADPPGAESVPAERLRDGTWRLVVSPVYAMGAARGDVVEVCDASTGRFTVISRGGYVCVQFYLAVERADDSAATAALATYAKKRLTVLNGVVDGTTPGLLVFSAPASAGMARIESVADSLVRRSLGAQWQYSNVFDPETGEELEWVKPYR